MAGPNFAEQVTSGNTQLSNPEQIFAGATNGINPTASAANGLTYVSSGQVYLGGGLEYTRKDDKTGQNKLQDGGLGSSPTAPAMAYPTVSVDAAQRQFWSLSADEMMQIDGYIQAETGSAPKTMASRKKFWDDLVLMTSEYSSSTGNDKWSPWDMGALSASKSTVAAGGGGGAYTGPSTTIYETNQVNLSNPTTAREVLDGAIGQYLGRAPNKKEYDNFLATLNGFEEDSPDYSRQVRKSSGSGNPASQTVDTDAVSSGGVNASQVAKEFAMRDEQYQETSVETKGIDTFLNMLRG
tara:strand:+ start:2964 stop:3851 length:888 start_codon:yes stop_codon:yes gene_type:complete